MVDHGVFVGNLRILTNEVQPCFSLIPVTLISNKRKKLFFRNTLVFMFNVNRHRR